MSEKNLSHVEMFLHTLEKKNPNQPEYIQAIQEVADDIIPWINNNPAYAKDNLLERICTPDRVINFKVTWENDSGDICINHGYRVQHNNALGPYKGGLRFHPSVNSSILKFLAFEQTFKNSLTALPLGSGKGGSDFDPKGKSEKEIKRFCQAFITKLIPYIGKDKDVPAGDIGVGSREISYMYGHLRNVSDLAPGSLTGKAISYGGSNIRLEATGYGCIYFLKNILENKGQNLKGKTAIISGAGNVSLYACEKLIDFEAKVLSLSDSKGFLHAPKGISKQMLSTIKHLRFDKHLRLENITKEIPGTSYHPGKQPWHIKADIALPCATENEIDAKQAQDLIKNGVEIVIEGANMPTSPAAIAIFKDKGVIYAPGKAANAGGVAISSLEMSQNSMRYHWERHEIDKKLENIMENIHKQCLSHGYCANKQTINYAKGANIAGFKRIADTMIAFGV